MFEHPTLKSMDSFRKKDSLITIFGIIIILSLLFAALILILL